MKKQDRGPAVPVVFLNDAELMDIDSRNTAANRLRTQFGLGQPGESELERLVAEVRYWRKMYAEEATAGSASASEPPVSQDLTNPAAASEKEGTT